jgi:MraZ protein
MENKLYFGKYIGACDEKNRVKIPSIFRDFHAGRVVITQGFDQNILVLPVDVFENLTRLLMALNIADPLVRRLQRMLIGRASFSEVDRYGNIKLPIGLKEFAGLEAEAVWVGQGKYLEIWSQALWQRQELDLLDVEANSQRFVSMNITGL